MKLFVDNYPKEFLIKGSILFIYVIILVNCLCFNNLSYSQWMIPPMPSPLPNGTLCCNNITNKSDITPPQITILTDKLFEGNNVLKLKILDDSPLKKRSLNYTVGNTSLTTYLAKEHNNEYKALVKAHQPSSKIIVTAIDMNDNVARLVKVIDVQKGLSGTILNLTNPNFWKNLIFGDKKH